MEQSSSQLGISLYDESARKNPQFMWGFSMCVNIIKLMALTIFFYYN